VKRVFTGVALALLVFAAIRYAPLPLFWAGLGALGVLAVRELSVILERLGRPPWPVLAYAGTLGLMACFVPPEPKMAAFVTAFVVLLFLRTVFSDVEPLRGADRLFGTLLPVLYLGLTLGHVGGLLAGDPLDREGGEDLLMLAIVTVYVGDTFAYYGGRRFGRRKLAPKLSPSKTWEGAAFNLLGSIGGALLGPLWFFQRLGWTDAIVIGVLLGVTGIVGDLSESLLKRAAQVKDSGGLLPGHGGVLDRIDSLLLAAPALYWYHRVFLVGG
jgi:phosphatidate cytidylyltransferase